MNIVWKGMVRVEAVQNVSCPFDFFRVSVTKAKPRWNTYRDKNKGQGNWKNSTQPIISDCGHLAGCFSQQLSHQRAFVYWGWGSTKHRVQHPLVLSTWFHGSLLPRILPRNPKHTYEVTWKDHYSMERNISIFLSWITIKNKKQDKNSEGSIKTVADFPASIYK